MWKKIVFFIIICVYCVAIYNIDDQFYDVDLEFVMKAQSQGDIVMQVFWDSGSGFNVGEYENISIEGDRIHFRLNKENASEQRIYRIDPMWFQQDFVFEKIWLNGKQISAEQFEEWTASIEQMEISVDENGYMNCKVIGDDSKFLMNEKFTKALLGSTKLPMDSKVKLMLVGIIMAFVMAHLPWSQIFSWILGTILMGIVVEQESVLARWKAENLLNTLIFYIIIFIFIGVVTEIIFWELKDGRRNEKICSNHEN